MTSKFLNYKLSNPISTFKLSTSHNVHNTSSSFKVKDTQTDTTPFSIEKLHFLVYPPTLPPSMQGKYSQLVSQPKIVFGNPKVA